MSKVLCVDDDPQLIRALQTNLVARGFEVDLAGCAEDALALAAASPPDVVILDLGLPGLSGLHVITELRKWSRVPIIVLSARNGERDKISALDAGADDYVPKPFGIGELLARLRAALRRSAGSESNAARVRTDHFVVDLAAKAVQRDGLDVRLTPTEWHLIEVLVLSPGKLVPSRSLLQQVWGPAYGDETNYLRVHFAHIRRKLEPEPSKPRYFLTEAGRGYRFVTGEMDPQDPTEP